ncbi:MAG: hypothetical protein NUW01_14345 [Gemmatimonadaceae bacterium]|nr:hypothetical protein [Gemmatimonadaceae bacterium]
MITETLNLNPGAAILWEMPGRDRPVHAHVIGTTDYGRLLIRLDEGGTTYITSPARCTPREEDQP